MPINWSGVFVPFHLIRQRNLLRPGLVIQDIRHLNFAALKRAGYKGVIFDKDNCLTKPGKDELVPDIESALHNCLDEFPKTTVVVSNSAGYHPIDPALLISESLSHNLFDTPVLSHASPKPSWNCIKEIQAYFRRIQVKQEETVVIGDRLFTDIVLANRMGALGVWTRGTWVKKGRLTRWSEDRVFRYLYPDFRATDPSLVFNVEKVEEKRGLFKSLLTRFLRLS